MLFSLPQAIDILTRTPVVLQTLLQGLSEQWTQANEGEDTWNACDVVGHLIYCEKADWLVRARIILSDHPQKTFEPFNRLGHLADSAGKTLPQLLDAFAALRQTNLSALQGWQLTENDLEKTGIHPAFGEVTLSQLLAAWAVHDLNHISQISRVLAKQYTTEVGPWKAYLRILQS